jgi:alpha-glucosidase (family GH31 glycosyl hydrolase)
MGGCLLIAPVFTGERTRTVIFPKGKWYDFYTGEFVAENEKKEMNTELNKIPLYVKDGGIIPMVPYSKDSESQKQPLEIRHYGELQNEFMLYDDDGLTFNYENGEFSWTKLSAKSDTDGQLLGYTKRVRGRNYSFDKMNWKFMTKNN